MRSVLARGVAAFAVTASAIAAPAIARAADSLPPGPIHREQLGASATGDAARARARKGDCAGALEAFDQAIARSIDPTLRRDRGLCHERLGNPYPAIDDYRAYLSASPDAPDADDIRVRLERLEEQVGVGGPAKHDGESTGSTASASGGANASVSVHVNGDGAGGTYDSAKLEESDSDTPLRRGRGFMLTPFVGVRHWFLGSGVSSSSWSEVVGARLNFWMNPTGSLFAELGYQRFNATQEDVATVAGLTTQLGYEARVPVKRDAEKPFDNQWVLGLGLGYESLWLSQTGAGVLATSSASYGGVLGRGRFGIRHNFAGRTGLEFTLDGAVGRFFAIGADNVKGETAGMLGLNIGLAFGL